MFTMASSEREAEPRDCVAVPSATSANKFAPATTRGRDAELAQAVSIWVSPPPPLGQLSASLPASSASHASRHHSSRVQEAIPAPRLP